MLITRYLDTPAPTAPFMQPGLAPIASGCSMRWRACWCGSTSPGVLGRLLAVEHAVPPRRGELQAYLDAETTRFTIAFERPRAHDVDIMEENGSGDIADLSAWVGCRPARRSATSRPAP